MNNLRSLFILALVVVLSSCSSLRHRVDKDVSSVDLESKHTFSGSTVYLKKILPDLFNKYPELSSPIERPINDELLKTEGVDYRLGAHDIVLVAVWDHPELTQPLGNFRTDQSTGQLIDAEGTMFYPNVGRIKVAGMTAKELSEHLAKELSKTLQHPQVDVKITAFRSKKIFVGGEVNKSGTYYFDDLAMTLPEIINRAGGLSEYADGSLIYLNRGGKVFKIDFLSMYKNGTPLEKINLKDGDKVYVSSVRENKVFVMGEVVSTSSIPLIHGNLSLTEALTEAKGMVKLGADAESIYVFRNGSEKDEIEVFHLDANNPVAMIMGDNFKLHPRDIVYVDTHKLVQWNRVLGLILPTVQMISSGVNTGFDIATDVKSW